MHEIRHYLTEDDKDIYLNWLRKVRDTVARIAIDRGINRIELGNFGDHEPAAMVYGNCVLMLEQATECITQYLAKRLSYCCAVVTSEHKSQI